MKRNLIILFISAFMASAAVNAETVSQKEAKALAQTFFNTAYGEVSKEPKLIWNGRQLTTNRLFSPFYIFNHEKGGYVIVSGENKAFPILGYSLKRKFDRSSLSDDENELLTKFAHEIEIIRYDSRVPVSAIKAWQNMPHYIQKILNSPYSENDGFNRLDDEGREKLENLDRTGFQILMPSAVEFPLYDSKKYRNRNIEDVLEVESEEEYIPFKFYDLFIEDLKRERANVDRKFELALSPDHPIVKGFGAGSYEIDFPENITLARVYSLDGRQVTERYFKDSKVIFLNLEGEANGFYIAMALAENGKIYGFKLAR